MARAAGPGVSASAKGRRLGWLGAYVGATFLSFPHPLGGIVLDLGWLLAWVGPACLVAGLSGLGPRRAAALGFAAAVAAHWAILHWIYVVTVRYGHAHPLVGVIAPLGLALYIASFTGLFALAWSVLERGSRSAGALGAWLASPLAVAALWTAADHLRSFAFTGFPWATLGYAQHQNPVLLGLAPFTGVYGLSFVSVLGGVAALEAARALRAGRPLASPVSVSLAVLMAAFVLGALARVTQPEDPSETVRVAVLQGNIDQGVKWSRGEVERTLAIYEELTRQARERGAEIVVWPETALPGALVPGDARAEWLAGLAAETGAQLVVGAVGLERRPGPGPPFVFDSAFLVDARGRLQDRYDKSHLVPFGEYIPFQDLVGRVLTAVARGIAQTGVTPGAGPRPVLLEPRDTGPITAGVPICYELLFPDLVRRFVRDGAEILLAITNDAWYGRTGAPYQFLAITALRSAENRVWTARAANTGVSAIIDAGGRVRARTRIFERGLLVEDVPLRPAPAGGSFYSRHGNVFAAACWIAAAGAWVALRVRGVGASRAAAAGQPEADSSEKRAKA